MLKNSLRMILLCVVLASCTSTKSTSSDAKPVTQLDGTWELNYITGPRIAFQGLYPEQKPEVFFDTKQNLVSGNDSCNLFSSELKLKASAIDFTGPMAMTKKMCMEGQEGQQLFMSTINKIDHYEVSADGKTLTFKTGDMAMMRFTKK